MTRNITTDNCVFVHMRRINIIYTYRYLIIHNARNARYTYYNVYTVCVIYLRDFAKNFPELGSFRIDSRGWKKNA